LNDLQYSGGAVVYWMSRDQRAYDNWALIYARELAVRFETSLAVMFCLAPRFLGATSRQYDFMIKGLKSVESDLDKLKIPFFVRSGNPAAEIMEFLTEARVGALVTDFSPLKIKRKWTDAVVKKLKIPFFEVDAHNIVPCWSASPKQEYAAYTIRPKLSRRIDAFLDSYPSPKRQAARFPLEKASTNWDKIEKTIDVDRSVKPIDWCRAGYGAGMRRLREFLRVGLVRYADKRNDPLEKAQSDLSPYLHFGQISAQRVALEVMKSGASGESLEAFMEELVVRRELSDNFCYYNSNYDSFDGFPEWAKKTLNDHREDRRGYRYSLAKLEDGKTHDDLWNAAQSEMVLTGKMPGYLRMYWAKKILEWSPSPEEALQTAIYLNDRYQLDGRDPNGYVGIAWSIGGVHDRAWPEREIFGKIRYMSYEGCCRKFDVESYIRSVRRIERQPR
jgi:deoxyribodipyrimidine photo-lyase